MFRLGKKVYIIGDRLELNLPIGNYGYIIGIEKNPDTVFDYIVRVPDFNRHFYLTAEDIELEEVLMQQEAERIEREALIDYALATRNHELFLRVMNGEEEVQAEEEEASKPQSGQDFLRQIHLKAWI